MLETSRSARVGIVIAVIAIAFAFSSVGKKPLAAPKVITLSDEPTSLLQTFYKVDVHARPGVGNAKAEGATPKTSGGGVAANHMQAGQDCVSLMPIDLRILRSVLSLAGLAPPDTACDSEDPMFGIADFALAQLAAKKKSQAGERYFGEVYMFVPISYVVVMMAILAYMFGEMVLGWDSKPLEKRFDEIKRPEADSWDRGYINWLFVDWIGELVTQWGTAAEPSNTKMKADHLDELCDPEDEVSACYEKLKVIWDEEVDRVGLENASIRHVLIRFVGYYRIAIVVAWSVFYESCNFLGPPLIMAWVIRYVHFLYIERLEGKYVTEKELTPGTWLAIFLFQGLPICIGITNSVCTMASARTSMRICGGLSSLVYKKAQRLPQKTLNDDELLVSNKWDMRNASTAAKARRMAESQGVLTPMSVSSSTAFVDRHGMDQSGTETTTDTEGTLSEEEDLERMEGAPIGRTFCMPCLGTPIDSMRDEDEVKKPVKFNLVQLVENDINTNVVDIPLAACRTVVIIPICFALFGLLLYRIGFTYIATFASVCVVAGVVFLVANSQVGYLMKYYYFSGKRLMFFEDLLLNIRTVKAFGWEGVTEEKINNMRKVELDWLWGFYKRLGLFYGISYQFPRLMILVSLWGYTCFYGSPTPVNIFATIPILFTLQSAVMSLTLTVPTVVNALPSLTRLDNFMKLDEAPLGDPNGEAPSWVDTWPAMISPGIYPGEERPSLRIQGSFKWKGQAQPALKNLNIIVPAGTSVAVLGKVGSGKSSLLNAMIGELYPVGDSRISIPSRVAYSAQTPYICETTVKDNILYGEMFDAERYRICVSAAGLQADIAALPNNGLATIGSRGMTLSAGQRARVSMARAAYCSGADVVVIDDPFSVVDCRTAQHVLDHLVHGPITSGRTRVVGCQPDPEHIQQFDKIIILRRGKVVAEGTPTEIMQTQEYRKLLNEHQTSTLHPEWHTQESEQQTVAHGGHARRSRPMVMDSREEEQEDRPDWTTIKHYITLGGWRLMFGFVILFLLVILSNLFTIMVLQTWATDATRFQAGRYSKIPSPNRYLMPFLGWWTAAILAWVGAWICGIRFTMNMSFKTNAETVRSILHAPVDKFFDTTPVGRIMNRMSTDLLNIDVNTFTQISAIIGILWKIVVPLCYIHWVMPIYFTGAAIPMYYVIYLLVNRFWNTLVPLRYLVSTSKSLTDATLTEVESSNAFVRASSKRDFRFEEFQSSLQNQLKADLTTSTFLKRWLVNRLFVILGFFICDMALVIIWLPKFTSLGVVGVCLTYAFQIIGAVEYDINSCVGAQFQFISMKRLYDYASLPQEEPHELEDDDDYQNYTIRMPRGRLGKLECEHTVDGIFILRSRSGGHEVILRQDGDSDMLAVAQGFSFRTLDPSSPDLAKTKDWHRLVAVNGRRGNIALMVDELCYGKSDDLILQVNSGWLLRGAHVSIKNLSAGYGNLSRNVLVDINIEMGPFTKTGVVGPTGCGKSTLLLCLLRIIEARQPEGIRDQHEGARASTILVNGVNTRNLGLNVLRAAIGMVPQDPVLMQCSVRDNIDPFNQFDDAQIWKGLEMVHLKQAVRHLPGGLDYQLRADGGILSVGQRQLLQLARLLITQPALVLLDEATSALDPASQELVQNAIEEYFVSSTLLVVAHRLETILNFDNIVVMEEGHIQEQGTLSELRKKNGYFARMLAAKKAAGAAAATLAAAAAAGAAAEAEAQKRADAGAVEEWLRMLETPQATSVNVDADPSHRIGTETHAVPTFDFGDAGTGEAPTTDAEESDAGAGTGASDADVDIGAGLHASAEGEANAGAGTGATPTSTPTMVTRQCHADADADAEAA